ncbi:hypothetical protein BEL04_14615 [Mucilaginibacter sp. PPCGB 2223]|uniref:SGNH/GDSL hydrolase family protein n=1 Tax=Mucilaginibacter sp. PPCGB 2223 TaxID=1886027 RepID=UPI000824D684|nr:GDSL-type esterase/lipase family protein [Mucilaginibacter sp. PPCGB 2223]OCX52676.1 hypothetical protein BEL04_14615 [Mucilaginibacter sp. PPCGB 2223]
MGKLRIPGVFVILLMIAACKSSLNIDDVPVFVAEGDSITLGGAIASDHRWVNIVCDTRHWLLTNLGVNGTTINSMDIGEINAKPAKVAYLSCAFSTNDVSYYTDQSSIDFFKAGYRKYLNTRLSEGWKADDIILVSAYLTNKDPVYNARQDMYIAAVHDIATEFGIKKVYDAKAYMLQHGGTKLVSDDTTHPTIDGYAVIAQGMIELLDKFGVN